MPPIVQAVIVVSKGKTLTWLDDCRIPYQNEDDKGDIERFKGVHVLNRGKYCDCEYCHNMVSNTSVGEKGRFPANLLVQDDVLNDGSNHKSGLTTPKHKHKMTSLADHNWGFTGKDHYIDYVTGGDSGSYSRYFDLDKWAEKNLTLNTKHKKKKLTKGKDKPMLLLGDSLTELKNINNESIDLIVTDPPYGIEFMGKDWDRALPSIEIWKECFRVLKTGKLAFVMCSPRQDVLSRMIISLEDAGFRTNYTSIYWTYASGFPKAANVSKLIDKKFKIRDDFEERRKPHKLFADYIKDSRIKQNKSMKEMASLFPSVTGGLTGCVSNWENAENVPTPKQYSVLKQVLNLDDSFDEFVNNDRKVIRKWEEAEREILHKRRVQRNSQSWNDKYGMLNVGEQNFDITKPATEEAKKMEGAYVGFQPKPAVEVILVVSKGKTLTWLDDVRIPYQSEDDLENSTPWSYDGLLKYRQGNEKQGYDKLKKIPDITKREVNEKGRFPANLLVSDDVLNDSTNHKSGKMRAGIKRSNLEGYTADMPEYTLNETIGDSGSYSRYFDLDKWWDKQKPKVVTRSRTTGDKYSPRGNKPFSAIDSYPDTVGKTITTDKTFPFLIVPKASKSEKNRGCEGLDKKESTGVLQMRQVFSETIFIRKNPPNRVEFADYLAQRRQTKRLSMKEIDDKLGTNTAYSWWEGRVAGIQLPNKETYLKLKQILELDDRFDKQMTEFIEVDRNNEFTPTQPKHNHHPTVKPLKLFSYLITMGSRENDIILDPFCGSGTTLIAADNLARKYIGIEINKDYLEIAKHRLLPHIQQTKLDLNFEYITPEIEET